MCINKNVVVGLVVAGLAIYLLAPQLIGAALPFLVVAICPLSMVVMMRAMSGGGSMSGADCSADGDKRTDTDIEGELADLRAEVARLRAERHVSDAAVERG